MPRHPKYTTPEMTSLARTYHMDKKQQEARYRCIEKLGNKCSMCGFDIPLALEILNPKDYPHKSWISKYKDVAFAPEKFKLVCANCNAIQKAATLKQRFDETVNILFRDALKQEAMLREAKEQEEAPPAIDHVEYERQRQEILKKAMEDQQKTLKREQEEWEKLDAEYAIVAGPDTLYKDTNVHTAEEINTPGEAHEALAADSER